ncbi:MAG TPA: hypothetical protein VFU30_05170 [Gaiellaceae bacterium]|nr:hypothetical protein [Gaiellaceae bacterium]
MSDRERLLDAIDRLAETVVGDRYRLEARRRDAKALAVLLVPAGSRAECPECELVGGRHVEGCSLAPSLAPAAA